MSKFLQPTLSGGELAPGLRGRTDLARFATSLGLCRNAVTKPTGGAAKRSGTIFRGRAKFNDRFTRLIPFIYSTQVKYMIEASDHYFRFWVNGALMTDTLTAITGITNAPTPIITSAGHGLQTGRSTLINGVRGMDRINGRTFVVTVIDPNTFSIAGFNSSSDPAFVAGGTPTSARVVEVPTPYTPAVVRELKFTQSADVLFITHPLHRIKELRRLTGTSFELRDFAFRRGPFRGFNADESFVMAVNATQGTVTVTANKDAFTPQMIGQLIYLEEKELRGIKPWASGEKNVASGALRRSDFKVYRNTDNASGGSAGTPYRITGATRPTHSSGRAWDGPGDIKNDGVNDYAVGAEWEFLHNVFGIIQIFAYTDARTVTGTVIERIPDSIIGTSPAPAAGPFPFVGDGVTKTFATPGITSNNPVDFVVTLSGAPVQANPSYPGGGGVGGTGGGNPRPGNDDRARIQLE